MTVWAPDSWRAFPAGQQPPYEDLLELRRTTERIHTFPALVAPREVERVKECLAEAARGERFVLQGGDCAERFEDCRSVSIISKVRILLQMSLVISYGARRPVVVLGRLGGQYAKPRSEATEVVGGATMPTFRGDNVNGFEPTVEARRPDPHRLEHGYFRSAATVNLIRALSDTGFATLAASENWELDWMPRSERQREYAGIAERIRDALEYLEQLGAIRKRTGAVDTFVSHEGLLLPYEEAMTRMDRGWEGAYNLGSHFLWIGDRTRRVDGAHLEYFRGIRNPIGLKVGPSCVPDELARVVEVLNPENEAGRLTVITRLGAERSQKQLPAQIRAVQRTGANVVWSCDPMHGNTTMTTDGFKTRRFDAILAELRDSFEIHRAENSTLGGVHFELTAEDVTECVGGVTGLTDRDLSQRYDSACDPRLNYKQSLEMAFLCAEMLRKDRR